jgi:predicted phosphodiesterase
MRKKDKLTLLCIADLHHWNQGELDIIKALNFDMCFTLGDIPQKALEYIRSITAETPLYGVPGNHDEWNTVQESGIINALNQEKSLIMIIPLI